MFENGHRSQCMVVHTIHSKITLVDLELQKYGTEFGIKYISLKGKNTNTLKSTLCNNALNNREERYKLLNDLELEEEAKHKGEEGTVRALLIKVSYNSQTLFYRVEQGMEKNKNNVLVLFDPRLKKNVYMCIREEFDKFFKVGEDKE